MGNSVIYKAKTSNADLVIHIALIAVMVGWFTIWGAIKRRNSHLVIYADEVVAKQGIMNTKSLSYPLSSIQAVGVEQGMLGKMFNYGTITITAAGSGHITLEAIDNPEKVKKVIYELKSK